MAERVAVIGAGIAGLGTAMALARAGRTVTIVERDPPAPDNIEAAFDTWERKGATQLRHSHVFLGKLVSLIRDRHPRLHRMLQEAGAREFAFEAALPPALRGAYARDEADRDLSFLFSRRTTLEHVMRAYVLSLTGVDVMTETVVRRLSLDRSGAIAKVTGLMIERNGAPPAKLEADVVVDASGRNGVLVDWLRDNGIAIDEERSPAGILYFTRHYRRLDGQDEPPRDLIPGAGDLGYIKYGVFPADNRHFSITICVPEIETKLRLAAVDPRIFDEICRQIPGAGRWIEPARAAPVTKVFGMGNLHNVWRHFVNNGRPAVLGFFAVGDAALRTNPLYGRGCSAAVIQAHLLADVLDGEADAGARALAFDARTRDRLRPFWNVIAKQDLGAIRRAKNEQTPGYRPRLKARLIKSFAEDAVGPASRGSLAVHRALMKGFHMFDAPAAWLRRPLVVLRVLVTWATPKRFKRALYPPKLGPERKEMLSQLGLEAA